MLITEIARNITTMHANRHNMRYDALADQVRLHILIRKFLLLMDC